tara:strand:+ start:254 stop:469 length:216 start_codon:yes stop_codon:yes gene_type:complete
MKSRKCMLPGLAKYKKSPLKQVPPKPVKKGKTKGKWTPETIDRIKKELKRYNENFQFGADGHWHNDGIGIT